jgi:hypothetical protein
MLLMPGFIIACPGAMGLIIPCIGAWGMLAAASIAFCFFCLWSFTIMVCCLDCLRIVSSDFCSPLASVETLSNSAASVVPSSLPFFLNVLCLEFNDFLCFLSFVISVS